MIQLKYIPIFLILSLLVSCGDSPSENQSSPTGETADSLPADFEEFYLKFHDNPEFQVAHISWPLAGQPSRIDTTVTEEDRQDFFWQKEDWKIHKPFNHGAEFTREFQVLGEHAINEISYHETLGLTMVRRFAKTSDGWKMIFYAAP